MDELEQNIADLEPNTPQDPSDFVKELLTEPHYAGEMKADTGLPLWMRRLMHQDLAPGGLVRVGDVVPGASQELAIEDTEEAFRTADELAKDKQYIKAGAMYGLGGLSAAGSAVPLFGAMLKAPSRGIRAILAKSIENVSPKVKQSLRNIPHAFHFSSEERQVLDPVRWGTGAKGQDIVRAEAASNYGLPSPPRTYFYVSDTTFKPEPGVGVNMHVSSVPAVFDPSADPELTTELMQHAREVAAAAGAPNDPHAIQTAWEIVLQQSGAGGYINPKTGVTVSFWPTSAKFIGKVRPGSPIDPGAVVGELYGTPRPPDLPKRTNPETIETKGMYIGGPSNVKSPQALGQRRREIQRKVERAATEAPQSPYFYRDSSEYLKEITPDLENATKLGAVAGKYSQSNRLGPDFDQAVGDYYRHLVDQPLVGTRITDSRDVAGKFLDNEGPLSAEEILDTLGNKLGPYATNLQHTFNPLDPELVKAVNDIWMGRLWDYRTPSGKPWQAGFSPSQHKFLQTNTDYLINQANAGGGLGGIKNWDERSHQAASWFGEKLEQGDITPDQVRSLREIGHDLVGSGTYELNPGAGVGHLPDIEHKLAESDKDMWGSRAWTDPETGKDVIYNAMGALAEPTKEAQGVFTPPGGPTEYNRAFVAKPVMAHGRYEATGEVDPVPAKLASLAERFRAVIDAQLAGAWNWADVKKSIKAAERDSLRVKLPLDAPMDERQMRAFEALATKHGFESVADIGGGEVVFTPGKSSPKGADLGEAVHKKVGELRKQINKIAPGAEINKVKFNGDYIDIGDEWKQGGGAVTKSLLDSFKDLPKMFNRIVDDPKVQEKLAQRVYQDEYLAQKYGQPVREDLQLLRKLLSQGQQGVREIRRLLRDNPSALPAGLIVSVLLEDQSSSSPPSEEAR